MSGELVSASTESSSGRWGPPPIQAKLLGAEKVTFASTQEAYNPYVTDYDAFFYPPGSVVVGPRAPLPTYTAADHSYDVRTKEIALPIGAHLSLELTRPILPKTAKSEAR